jgi:CDP-paratose 2-epimerase
MSRAGVERNLAWLCDRHRDLEVVTGDVGDVAAVRKAVADCTAVVHLAAQVAVTSSVTEPRADFATNLAGTLNVLEEVRRLPVPPTVLFTSTNKVYGHLADVELTAASGRYLPMDDAVRVNGIAEDRPLQFASPYGCSKGGADQYVLDYGATYGLRTVVFRMSCIYGPHQHGTTDQGWVAHFLREALAGRPLTIYGDGRQVRDVLHVSDLVHAVRRVLAAPDVVRGQAFNIGGGPAHTLSLLELLDLVSELTGHQPQVEFAGWRTGDQRWYVSDTRKFSAATGWAPRVGVRAGLLTLHDWLVESGPLLASGLVSQ